MTPSTLKSINVLEQVLPGRGFRKVSGAWESRDKALRIYPHGRNPLREWKAFQREADKYVMVPGGSGEGADSLTQFLNHHS